MYFHIHDFANLIEPPGPEPGQFIETDAATALGYSWKLRIYPRGWRCDGFDNDGADACCILNGPVAAKGVVTIMRFSRRFCKSDITLHYIGTL